MDITRVQAIARELTKGDSLLNAGPDRARLVLHLLRALASGHPVSEQQVDGLFADLGLVRDEAHRFLRRVTERDADGSIVGTMGLSLNHYPHRFAVNGVQLSTWCAWDTLFLPAMLGQAATVEAESPLSKQPIRLTVGPDGVLAADPGEAMLSIVVSAPETGGTSSVESMWQRFCHHIHFFPSREEAERWAAGRNDIAILSVDEGYTLGQQVWGPMLAHVP